MLLAGINHMSHIKDCSECPLKTCWHDMGRNFFLIRNSRY